MIRRFAPCRRVSLRRARTSTASDVGMRTDMIKLRLSALAVLLCLTSLSAFGVFFPWPTTPTTVTWYFNPANWPINLTQANIVAALQAAADEWPQQAGAPIHLV